MRIETAIQEYKRKYPNCPLVPILDKNKNSQFISYEVIMLDLIEAKRENKITSNQMNNWFDIVNQAPVYY